MEIETKKYITLLKNFLGDKINSILEIQCGDAYDIENCIALQDNKLKYIGIDVVDEIITENRKFFKDDKNKLFITMDAINESIPQCDLVICGSVMEYLPIDYIWTLLENIKNSKAKYIALDYYTSQINNLLINENIEIKLNSEKIVKRAINLTQSPFYFPLPQFLIPTDNINQLIALYKIEEIEFYMQKCDENVAYLKSRLVPYLENDFNEFITIFEKEKNGKKLLKDALTANELIWNNIYYNEPYRSIIDKNNLFIKWVNFLLFLYQSKDIKRLHQEQPERYKNLITEDNFELACVITQDFIKWKLNKYF